MPVRFDRHQLLAILAHQHQFELVFPAFQKVEDFLPRSFVKAAFANLVNIADGRALHQQTEPLDCVDDGEMN